MKKLLFLLLTCSLFVQLQAQNTEVASPQFNQQYLLNYYNESYEQLAQTVGKLNKEQMHYKPAADKWSISQCLEHLVKTEPMLWGFIQQTLSQDPNPERRSEMKMSDQDVINTITDRSFKAQAPNEIAPSEKGAYDDPAAALKDIQQGRESIFSYIKSTTIETLRTHISDSHFGPIDAYQFMLYVPGHALRHLQQIKEIMDSKGFPQ